MAAITVFLAGSLLCGPAGPMHQLAVLRALRGIGGGLTALAFAVMGDVLSPELRARYQIWFSSVPAVAGVMGPPVGGLFAGADTLLWIDGWRWAFLIDIPIGIVARSWCGASSRCRASAVSSGSTTPVPPGWWSVSGRGWWSPSRAGTGARR